MGKRGPSPIKINWKEFDKLASYQCTQLEIADFFGIDISTLENACERNFGVKLSVLWDQKKGQGRLKLKKIQFTLARSSPGMAIFLGKQMLGQTDEPADLQILSALQAAGLTTEEAVKLIREQASRAELKGKKSFAEFCLTAKYPAPFPKQIEMYEFAILEEIARLLLGARGYGKTDYAVICGLAYDIYLNPFTSTNLVLSKSKERNASIIKEVADACRANGMHFEKENATSLRVAGLRGKDHSLSTLTVRGLSLRGRHPKRVIFDDPVTEDDTSQKTRDRVEKVFNEVMKLTSNVLIIGQPAHKFDLYAKLRPLLKKMELPHGTIPELDHDLVAQRAAGVSEESISASYHLKILDVGTTPFDKVKYLDVYPVGSSVAFIDPSHEGNDLTALAIMRAYMGGVAVVGFCWKRAWNHCADEMLDQIKKFSVARVCFETNGLGDMPVELLRKGLGNTGIGVVGRKSLNEKHSRIMAAGALAHNIHLARESHKLFIDRVVQYEYGAEPDDPPDALSTCLEWLGLIRGKQ